MFGNSFGGVGSPYVPVQVEVIDDGAKDAGDVVSGDFVRREVRGALLKEGILCPTRTEDPRGNVFFVDFRKGEEGLIRGREIIKKLQIEANGRIVRLRVV